MICSPIECVYGRWPSKAHKGFKKAAYCAVPEGDARCVTEVRVAQYGVYAPVTTMFVF